jgi:hypothetical protein
VLEAVVVSLKTNDRSEKAKKEKEKTPTTIYTDNQIEDNTYSTATLKRRWIDRGDLQRLAEKDRRAGKEDDLFDAPVP